VRQWHMRLERAQYEADLAQRRYEQVDPANRLVAASLPAPSRECRLLLRTKPSGRVGTKAQPSGQWEQSGLRCWHSVQAAVANLV
jgi:hypothetical protein